MDAAERIQRTLREFEERARQATTLQSTIQDIHGNATSPDGTVTVTVAPSGAILNLELTPNAVRKTHTDLQQSIMAAIRQATENAAEQLNETVAPVLGDQFEQFQEAFNAQVAQPLRPDTARSDSTRSTRQANNDPGDEDFSNDSFLR